MGKRPSFFDKLTGKSAIEDIEQSAGQDINITTAGTIIKKNKEKETTKEMKDWPPETEGQLTIDVYQTTDEIIIKSTIAGINPEDLDITVTNDMVTIKGRRQRDEEIKTEDYFYQECYWGAFSRSIILPTDIDADKVEASMKNGILTIRLPKIEKTKTKKIKVMKGS